MYGIQGHAKDQSVYILSMTEPTVDLWSLGTLVQSKQTGRQGGDVLPSTGGEGWPWEVAVALDDGGNMGIESAPKPSFFARSL